MKRQEDKRTWPAVVGYGDKVGETAADASATEHAPLTVRVEVTRVADPGRP